MANAKLVNGNFGASTSPISFAPAIKSNKERLLKNFREQLGQKGYSPAEASTIAGKVRADANALALEVNAREGNDDRVRMANIHTMALKMKIADAFRAAPKKPMNGDEMMGRLSKTSPMSVSVADSGKTYNANVVNKRAKARDRKREAVVYDWEQMRKKHGKLKDSILNEALRASYMQQFNGSLGHYHGGTMGIKFLKKAAAAVKKVAAPIQKVAAKVAAPIKKVAAVVAKPVVQASKYTVKSAVRAVNIVKKDPVAALTKLAIAPVTLVASVAPAHTDIGKAARKIEQASIKVTKAIVGWLKKVIDFIWNNVIKQAWEFTKKLLKKVWNWFGELVDYLKNKVWDKFHGSKGISGMGEMGANEKAEEMKQIEKSVSNTANRLKAKGEGAFVSGMQTFALKDISSGAGCTAGTAAVSKKIGIEGAKIILSGGTGSMAAAASAAVTFLTVAAPVTAEEVVRKSPDIGKKVVSDLKDVAFDEACKDYANDLAARKLKGSPIAQAVTQQAINGELKGNIETVKAVATGITDPSKREQFIAKAASLPEQKRIEMIKQVAIPQDFKPMVKNLDAQTEKLAATNVNKITKDPIKEAAAFANTLGSKDSVPLPPQAVNAIAVQGKIVQDDTAAKLNKEGKIDKTEAIAAMSSIGQKAVIQSLPVQQRAVVVKAVQNETPEIIKEAVQDKKKNTNTALLAAAAIAAKVLLF